MGKTVCNSWVWLNGNKYCPLFELTGCRMTGNIKCGMNETSPEISPKGSIQGWECPRCRKIHSPYIPSCDCPVPTDTRPTYNPGAIQDYYEIN